MSSVINNNIPVTQASALYDEPLYDWVSIKAGQLSKFAGIKMFEDLDMNNHAIMNSSGGVGNVVGSGTITKMPVWTGPEAIGDSTVTDAGGVTIGNPVGGGKGLGSLNTEGLIYVNNVPVSVGGEANTASSAGTGGVGLTLTKLGVDLPFKNIDSGSSKIVVTDDIPNNNVDIDVNEANLTLDNIGGTLSVDKGGTGTTTHTSNNFLQGNGTSPVTATKVVPTGAVVGTTDTQTLTNKTIDTATSNITIDALDVTSGTFANARISSSSVVQHEANFTLDSQIGTLSVGKGGTGAITHTVGNFLQGNGTGAVTAPKTAPVGDVVGTTDTQILTNKTIDTASNDLTIATADVTSGTFADARISSSSVVQHEANLTLDSQIGTLSVGKGGTGAVTHSSGYFLEGRGTDPVVTLQAAPTGLVVGTTDTQTLTNKTITNPLGIVLGDMTNVDPNGGLGSTTGDRLTYVKNNLQVGGYSFIPAPINWTNISVVSGAIAFENLVTPLTVTGSTTPQLINFPGVLQSGSFLITSPSPGRLTNTDGFTWSFQINFSCSLTGANNSEWTIELFVMGIKVSNPYTVTVSSSGRYVSITGVWTQAVRGGDASAPPYNEYAEIYLTRNLGTGDADINSAYLSMTAVKLLDRP
jgi:hypothetical protein